MHYFRIGSAMSLRKCAQVRQKRDAVLQVAARQFTTHKRVHEDKASREQIRQFRLCTAKMGDPDRGIHEDH